ncbi:MAG: ABC transporter permease, partial [Acidimicrobiaceae bacterium]|nr:ABC transporter permease [Acidimicrobiaceae bacterium]
MTARTAATRGPAGGTVGREAGLREAGFREAMVAEWIKFTSVRSHRFTLAAFGILSAGVSIAVGAANGAQWAHASHNGYDPTNQALAGLAIGQLAIGVLGALVITGEFSSGSIRSTLAAVPRRPRMLLAKAAVFWATALVACEVITWLVFFAGQVASGPAPHATLGQPGVARAILLTGAFLPLLGLFALGVGTLVRNSAGAIAIFVGFVFVVPLVLGPIHTSLSKYTPLNIEGSSVASTVGQPDISPWVGFGLMALYAAVVFAAGLVI